MKISDELLARKILARIEATIIEETGDGEYASEVVKQLEAYYASKGQPKLEAEFLIVHQPDGCVFQIPAMIIAEHRAKHYAKVDCTSFEESLYEDTIPTFNADNFELIDWAENNMDWGDVVEHAVLIEDNDVEADYEDGWVSGHKEIRSVDANSLEADY